MKIKVSEATNNQLNWLATKCEEPIGGYKAWVQADLDKGVLHGQRYAEDWHWSGPIIEREAISIGPNGPYVKGKIMPESWCASISAITEPAEGPTPLIAACRCYVASKLGNEVEVPDGLA